MPRSIPTALSFSNLVFVGLGCKSSTLITHQYVPKLSLLTVQVPCLHMLWSNVLFLHSPIHPNFGSFTFQLTKSKCTELMNFTESFERLFDLNFGYLPLLRKNAVKALSRLLSDCCNASLEQSLSHLNSSFCFKAVSSFASSTYVTLVPFSL